MGTNSLATSYTHSDSWILNAEFALANTPEGFCKSLKLLCAKKELAATRRDAHHGASMFKHLIWDWNGTLLDDAAACVAAINTLLARRRLPQVSRQQYLDVFDFPGRNYYLQLGFDFAREDWDRLTEEYHAEYAETSRQSPLRAGTQAALTALQAAGLSLSVLSASELKLLRRMMDERGILVFFIHL